ncbi:uncharacterized protein LTR77_005249 [Saxophila tyrrhenica]|uniref:Asp/Glu/hydantoin racemase n=1 Tax=Saxophila tyrrhenica TaxID=1690608 RepID=A0AAV9PEN3_9PEZI|nr:hypothetical protein LTR77_005249 [Saxophila tyrrhenica]
MSPPKPTRLGVLVPSSNTALEPLTTAIISALPNVTVHFSRFPVTEISLSAQALSQFDDSKILEAATLLQHANVDVIGWSGTSAGWLGLGADERLCARIEEVTGIRATTSEAEAVRFGLVTPYLDDVQQKIVETFGGAGFEVVAESHLGRKVNVEFAEITEQQLDSQMKDVVSKMDQESVMLVSTFCTNLRAAQRLAHWEKTYPGLIVADTVATVIWDMLKIAGVDPSGVKGWGALFSKT